LSNVRELAEKCTVKPEPVGLAKILKEVIGDRHFLKGSTPLEYLKKLQEFVAKRKVLTFVTKAEQDSFKTLKNLLPEYFEKSQLLESALLNVFADPRVQNEKFFSE